jgi:hypothetical protein
MSRNRGRRRNTETPKTPAVRQKVLDVMKRGGQLVKTSEDGGSLSDEELLLAIKGTEVALSYLEGRGRSFDLAANALRQDLSVLEQYRDMRKQH